MAESVARVKILAQVEGLEGFDKLKGAFKGLQQAIGPAESELDKARKQILEFGKAGAQTEQVLKGQVEALKALQAQAVIGGTVYRQLGKDVKALGGAYKEAAGGVKEFSDAQLRSQIVGSKPSTFDKQIAALRRGLQDLSVYSRQYSDALTEIQRRQIPFNAAVGRQNVIAGAQAYAQGGKGGSALPELPNTTAALQQRMTELSAEFPNLIRGGEDWIRVSREIANVQRRLNQEFANPAVEAARRRLEASRNTSSGFLAFSSGLEDRIAVQKSIARNQRKQAAPAIELPMMETSDLYRSIQDVGLSRFSSQLQLMGNSYEVVAADIRKATAASDGSINSLMAQRQSWQALRNAVSNNKAAYREISAEIARVDRQLEKRGMGGNRGGAAQIGQGLGALAASGIFGGPEGFLGSAGGAAIGALVGGPAGLATGAFIGGSVGAYGGMARQGLGAMSTYAADISKQEIALKGITKTQEEYTRALAASAAVTRDFNVPQLEATRGITQLSAAVIGAGGKVADAEVVFRNVTAAIKASGGSAEDVQGAMTALSQIFSKGKVSAEELQGQLGERLPGAVTMFAKATGRTLPQLQKDLEQGVVGLADLMKFVVSDQGLGQFEQRAQAVAKSSADAGARLTVAWNDARRAIGQALLPLGAQIQDSLTNALKEATPALVQLAKGLVVLVGGAGKAASAFLDFTKPFRDFFGVAIPAYIATASAFWGSLKNDLDSFWSRVNDFLGGIGRAFTGFFENLKKIGGGALRALGVDTEWLGQATSNIVNQLSRAWDALFAFVKKRWKETVANMINNTNPLFFILKRTGVADVGGAIANGLSAGGSSVAAGTSVAPPAPTLPPPDTGLTNWQIQQEQKNKAAKQAADNAAREAERLAAEQQRLDEQLARNAIQLDDERFRHRQELIRKEFEYQQELAQRQNELWANNFVGLGAQSARAIADLFGKLDSYRKAQFDVQLGIATARQGVRSAQALEGVTSQGLPGGNTARFAPMGAGSGGGQIGKLSSQGRALVAAAQKLGVSPLDLATIIGFETAGTYSPSKRGGTGGNYMGLIQFGPNERKAYGANPNQSFEEQVTGPVVRYFKDRFKGVGMSTQGAGLLTLYRTVLGGNPKASLTARDSFGTSPQSGVARMAPHRSEALRRFFGGDVANIPSTAAGVAGQVRRDVSAEGQVAVSQEQLLQQQKLAAFEKKRIEALKSFDFTEFNQELTRGLVEQNLALSDGIGELQLRNRLEAEGMRPELVEAEMKKAQLYRDQQRLLEPLQEAQSAVDDPAAKEQIAETIANINNLYAEQIGLIERQTEAQLAQGAALAAYVGQLKLQLSELTNIENVLISVGQTVESEISTAMSTAISNVVTGSGTVKQAMADMLRNIGQSFVQMATQIIAKQMVMIVLGSIMKALGVGVSGGGGLSSGFDAGTSSAIPTDAGGWANSFNTPLKFAKGGVVSRPTYFKFANGGQVQNGIMGEAGPEAIVPLKRGFDGRLGIAQVPAAQGGDTRMRDMMGRSPAAAQSPVLNMKFETTSINGVEYVSREQLELAMAQTRRQAANEGAKRGMNMTLDKMQNSPSTRSRVGIR